MVVEYNSKEGYWEAVLDKVYRGICRKRDVEPLDCSGCSLGKTAMACNLDLPSSG